MHSRRWTGGASACWCTSFWPGDHPSQLMETRTLTQTSPSMDSPRSPTYPPLIIMLQRWLCLSHTSQEDLKEGSSVPQRHGTARQRPHPETPRQRSKEEIRLRSEWSRECKETPVLPGGSPKPLWDLFLCWEKLNSRVGCYSSVYNGATLCEELKGICLHCVNKDWTNRNVFVSFFFLQNSL